MVPGCSPQKVDTELSEGLRFFELLRGDSSESRMNSFSVIEHLYILKYAPSSLVAALIDLMKDQLGF
jgi:hypothetical protein